MKVTNVSVKLAPLSADRLKAFCTMTVDDEFVVRDLKVIEGTSGLFVAMPSRKLTDHCPTCGGKNHLRAKFCNDCGAKLPENRASDEEAQGKLHADIAHPINAECRNRLQAVILDAFRDELRRAGRDQDARVVDRELGDEPPAEVAPEPPAPSEFEPVAPEPVAPEPVAPEPVAPELVAPEPVAPEPVAPEPVAPEPVAPEPVAPERTSEGSLVPEPTETVPEPATPEPAPPEEPEPDEPEPDEPEPDEPEPDEPEPEEPDTGDQGGEEEPGKGHIFGEGIL